MGSDSTKAVFGSKAMWPDVLKSAHPGFMVSAFKVTLDVLGTAAIVG